MQLDIGKQSKSVRNLSKNTLIGHPGIFPQLPHYLSCGSAPGGFHGLPSLPSDNIYDSIISTVLGFRCRRLSPYKITSIPAYTIACSGLAGASFFEPGPVSKRLVKGKALPGIKPADD